MSLKNKQCFGFSSFGTPVANLTPEQLNAGLTNSQRQGIQRVNPTRTGQTTSYRTGDDGNLQKGNPTAGFSTLASVNSFNNSNRFTDELGGQTYTNNLVCDWQTGLMWYRIKFTNQTWNQAIDGAEASSQGGFTDWRVPNVNEQLSIFNWGNTLANLLNYSPFNITDITTTTEIPWTSTTSATTTTQAMRCFSTGVTAGNKTSALAYFICRNFTLAAE